MEKRADYTLETRDVQRIFGVSRQTVMKWVRKGYIHAIRHKWAWMFSEREVQSFQRRPNGRPLLLTRTYVIDELNRCVSKYKCSYGLPVYRASLRMLRDALELKPGKLAERALKEEIERKKRWAPDVYADRDGNPMR